MLPLNGINASALHKSGKIIFIALVFLLISLVGFGQEKRIYGKRIPISLKHLVKENYPEAKHLKFFEENENGIVYIECTFLFQRRKYELKFISDSLVETEIEVAFDRIQKDVQNLIISNLDSIFEAYSILDVQEVMPASNTLYEINIKTRENNYYELFYTQAGILVEKKRITLTSIPSLF